MIHIFFILHYAYKSVSQGVEMKHTKTNVEGGGADRGLTPQETVSNGLSKDSTNMLSNNIYHKKTDTEQL